MILRRANSYSVVLVRRDCRINLPVEVQSVLYIFSPLNIKECSPTMKVPRRRLSRPHLRVNARLHFTNGVLLHENISLVKRKAL